ncbi:hypothetical protein BSZ32_09940, partial [Rubritalea profundi]
RPCGIGYLAPLGSRRALSFWQITPAFVSFESLSGIKIFFHCALRGASQRINSTKPNPYSHQKNLRLCGSARGFEFISRAEPHSKT